jgi:peptidyl-prolyl cis-trans isomerase C
MLPSLFTKTRSRQFLLLVVSFWTLYGTPFLISAKEEEDDEVLARRAARLATKPWYTRNIQLGDAQLPFSPVTVFLGLMSVLYLVYYWSGSQSYAEAAHILLADKSDDAKDKLEGWKAKIGSDFTLFSKYAKEHSACPSKQGGGNLGKFRKNDMAPPFDKAVFDPNTPLKTTIGPIRTQFGWHLIYVHKRDVPKS